ncbi:hypothetical protein GCM10007377_03450 [Galliscardovia ingluviei]|uniref:Uncharacterized protein n=1 Tax=Galliscardovia ingluviei TaxID=1769422 RepID=A0A8J3F135_9BIFI|nr:hypothetical protein [Galliscardovia ingluviei]GGI12936.1 hypothetical protein GCM10007377_03450 [Galliscardovia ingluviei]
MAGLIKDNFDEEVLIELSWIMNVIDEIAEKYGIETYETILIKYRVQPEEEQCIDKFIALHVNELESLSIIEIQKEIASYYFALTKRQWHVADDVVEKLIKIRKDELLN